MYLLDPTGEKYQLFHLLQKEFTFDVDLSQVGCGMNAALYFSEMNVDGGAASTNAAGAKYGTGYCDAQCPTGDNFIDGQVRIQNTPAAVRFDNTNRALTGWLLHNRPTLLTLPNVVMRWTSGRPTPFRMRSQPTAVFKTAPMRVRAAGAVVNVTAAAVVSMVRVYTAVVRRFYSHMTIP